MGINLINLHAKVLDQCLVHGNYYVSNYLCNVLFHLICQIVPFHRLGFVNCPRLRSKKWGRTSIQSHKACVVSTQVYALLDLSHSKVHFRRPHFFLPFDPRSFPITLYLNPWQTWLINHSPLFLSFVLIFSLSLSFTESGDGFRRHLHLSILKTPTNWLELACKIKLMGSDFWNTFLEFFPVLPFLPRQS